MWLFANTGEPGQLVERWHCSQCQPHQVELVMCRLCGTTVMLGGDLAANRLPGLPDPVQRWLIDRGWRQYPSTWECGQHPARQRSLPRRKQLETSDGRFLSAQLTSDADLSPAVDCDLHHHRVLLRLSWLQVELRVAVWLPQR